MTLWMEALISFETSEHTHPKKCRNIQRHRPDNLPVGRAYHVLRLVLFQLLLVSVQDSKDSDRMSLCWCLIRKYRQPRQLSASLWCYRTSRLFFVFLFDSKTRDIFLYAKFQWPAELCTVFMGSWRLQGHAALHALLRPPPRPPSPAQKPRTNSL